jgi:tetratricopeptide (TPR) repeat protein
MPIGLRVRALRAYTVAGVALAVAGCAMLRRSPPPAPLAQGTADSGAARTYLSLADPREDKSDWAGAQSVVDKGLAQQPGNQALLLRRAQILLHRAEGEDAPARREEARTILAQCAEASDARTSDAEMRASLAWLDFAAGHREDALAASLAESGEQPDLALTLAREARALRPRDPEIADTLGLVHLRRGQASAALEVLGEAAGTHPVYDPGYAEVLYHNAMAFEATQDRKSAKRTVKVALTVLGDRKPEPAWAARARSVLERARPAAPTAPSETAPSTP